MVVFYEAVISITIPVECGRLWRTVPLHRVFPVVSDRVLVARPAPVVDAHRPTVSSIGTDSTTSASASVGNLHHPL